MRGCEARSLTTSAQIAGDIPVVRHPSGLSVGLKWGAKAKCPRGQADVWALSEAVMPSPRLDVPITLSETTMVDEVPHQRHLVHSLVVWTADGSWLPSGSQQVVAVDRAGDE